MKQLKMIIADSSAAALRDLQRAVEGFDLNVQVAGTACGGEEALELISQVKPHFILTDIELAGRSGLEVAEQAQQLVPGCKIIILSFCHQFGLVRRAFQLGVFDYLLKPVDYTALRCALVRASAALPAEWTQAAGRKGGEKRERDLIDLALEQISCRYTDEQLRLSILAADLYVSSAFLSRGIKRRTSKTFSDYLTQLRIEKSIELMNRSQSARICWVAEQVGYSSQHYFCRKFKKYTGCTPSEYLRMQAEQRAALSRAGG